MDFKKLSTDAGSFFQRTMQKTEEAFKTSERTLLDASLENTMRQCDIRQRWANSFKEMALSVIQPNPANRMEDMVLKGFDRTKQRNTEEGKFGDVLTNVGQELGATTPYGTALTKFGKAEIEIGACQQVMQQDIEAKYIQPISDFLTNSCVPCKTERDALEKARLDLDYAKTQLRRSGNDQTKKSKLEQTVTEKQTLFDRQCETTKTSMDKLLRDFDSLRAVINSFISIQKEYHQKCLDALDEACS